MSAEQLPGTACPFCGSRRAAPFFSHDDARADSRRYVCNDCASTWSVDGAQLDLFATGPASAPAERAEDLDL
jgi:DNA-directed RNA polymerase subunit RPC12/RpoP